MKFYDFFVVVVVIVKFARNILVYAELFFFSFLNRNLKINMEIFCHIDSMFILYIYNDFGEFMFF